jgi:site-specific DNA-cytosine methylase
MTAQKKHIGNSVEVKVGVALFQAIDKNIQKQYKLAA